MESCPSLCEDKRHGAGLRHSLNKRAAERDVATFRALDRNGAGRITHEDVRGNIDMQARFNDIDINRDGVITVAELERYVRLRYGVSLTVGLESHTSAPPSNAAPTDVRREASSRAP